MVDEWGDAIRADLAEYYRIDLADVWRGLVSVDHVLALIEQLPQESRYAACVLHGGSQWRGWTFDRQVHAYQANTLAWLLWLTANQNAKRRSKQPVPLPMSPKDVARSNKKKPNTLLELLDRKKRAIERRREQANKALIGER